MAILVKFDLEKGDLADIYQDIKDTQKYLNDVKTYIDTLILNDGKQINGLRVVEKKTRRITDLGYKQLENAFGKEFITITKVDRIGITALEKKLDREEVARLEANGGIVFDTRLAVEIIADDDVDSL